MGVLFDVDWAFGVIYGIDIVYALLLEENLAVVFVFPTIVNSLSKLVLFGVIFWMIKRGSFELFRKVFLFGK